MPKIVIVKDFNFQDEVNPVKVKINDLDRYEMENRERKKSKPRVRRKTGEDLVQLVAHRKSTHGLDYVHSLVSCKTDLETSGGLFVWTRVRLNKIFSVSKSFCLREFSL